MAGKARIKSNFIIAAVCILISCVFITAGLCQFKNGSSFLHNLTILADGSGFSTSWLKDIFVKSNTEEVSFAAWTELKGEQVFENNGSRHYNTDVCAVYGESGCILPFGQNLPVSDKQGCIIGIKLSEELFGNYNAEGQEIVWKDRVWIVRGVVKKPSSLFMAQVSGMADKIKFDRINIRLEREKDRRRTGEDFINRHGLYASVLRWDYLYSMAWLEEVIPGRWSDFQGFKENLKKHGKAAGLVRNTEKTSIEAEGLSCQKKGRWLAVTGIFFLITGSVFYFNLTFFSKKSPTSKVKR